MTIAVLALSLACDTSAKRAVVPGTDVAQDQKALEHLHTAGSDLSKTHTIEFYLHVPSQKDAAAAAATRQSNDFDTLVQQDAHGKSWLCLAQKRMIPTIENLTQAREIFKTLAARYRGKYDGWKAAVEP